MIETTAFTTEDLTALTGKWRDRSGNLIMVLHEIQNACGYVPRSVALELARQLDIPLARIYEVITFYNYFKLEAPGKFTIAVCLGTACYLKGAAEILTELKTLLDIDEGQTTPDGLFHLDPVRCLGCCSLAPVMSINGKIYGKVKKTDLAEIIRQCKKAHQATLESEPAATVS